MLTLEQEFRLARIDAEASRLDAEDLRRVLRATWSLWLHEREALKAACAREGVAIDIECQHAFPLEMAQRLAY